MKNHAPRRFAIGAILLPAIYASMGVTLAVGLASSTEAQGGAGRSPGRDACASIMRPPATVTVEVRARCQIVEDNDPYRTGTALTLDTWVGVCEVGDPDDQCIVKSPFVVGPVGSEVEETLYSATLGPPIELLPAGEICLDVIGCHETPAVNAYNSAKVTVASDEGPNEVSWFTPAGGEGGVNPGQNCFSNIDGDRCQTGGGRIGNDMVSIDAPTDWLDL